MRVGCVTVCGLIVDDGAVLIEPEHFSWCVRASSLSSENEPNGYVSPSWTSMIFADVQRGLDTLEEVSLVSWLRIVSFYAPHCEHRHRLSGLQNASTSSSPCKRRIDRIENASASENRLGGDVWSSQDMFAGMRYSLGTFSGISLVSIPIVALGMPHCGQWHRLHGAEEHRPVSEMRRDWSTSLRSRSLA